MGSLGPLADLVDRYGDDAARDSILRAGVEHARLLDAQHADPRTQANRARLNRQRTEYLCALAAARDEHPNLARFEHEDLADAAVGNRRVGRPQTGSWGLCWAENASERTQVARQIEDEARQRF